MKLFVLSKNEKNETIERPCKNYQECEFAVEDAQFAKETSIRVCVSGAEKDDFIPDFFQLLQERNGKRFAMYRVV